MRLARALAIIALTVFSGACAQLGPALEREPVQWVGTDQPLEPDSVRPARRQAGGNLVVLLPKPNGNIGGVVVRNSSGEVLLNKAYAGAAVDSAGNLSPVTYTPERVESEFGPVIAALPGRPATFLLYFLEGKDELTPDSVQEIERVFVDIASRPDPQIWVIGHTDAVGTVQYNDQLSLQRAQKVRDELVRRGIAADRIEVSARGKREPLVPTSQGVPEPKNRRVEISVR
jgi:outer membrane protein OmpA-like peptidoglycan-associated protein